MFRETDYKILDSVEAIQDHLDDHLLKTQIMRGSPYFKAFESKFNAFLIKNFYNLTTILMYFS